MTIKKQIRQNDPSKEKSSVCEAFLETLAESSLANSETLCFYTDGDMIITTKDELTAMDAVHIIESTEHMQNMMYELLQDSCGLCSDCDDCNDRDGHTFEGFCLPKYLLQEAGIRPDAKLCVKIDREKGMISFMESTAEHDLSDIPPCVVDKLFETGICISTLEKLLVGGDIIYGRE